MLPSNWKPEEEAAKSTSLHTLDTQVRPYYLPPHLQPLTLPVFHLPPQVLLPLASATVAPPLLAFNRLLQLRASATAAPMTSSGAEPVLLLTRQQQVLLLLPL